MSFLDRFLKSKAPLAATPTQEEQAVLVHIGNEDLEGSIPLQETLHELLESSAAGMYDGNEVGEGELVLFMYGPDAEILFKHIEPTLRADEFCKGAKVVIRWGGPNAPKREVIL